MSRIFSTSSSAISASGNRKTVQGLDGYDVPPGGVSRETFSGGDLFDPVRRLRYKLRIRGE
jgi:hypothetical protein